MIFFSIGNLRTASTLYALSIQRELSIFEFSETLLLWTVGFNKTYKETHNNLLTTNCIYSTALWLFIYKMIHTIVGLGYTSICIVLSVTFFFIDLVEENRQLKEQKTCKICLNAEVGVVFQPCGHLCCCVQCASAVQKCPICRKQISGSVRTFIP